MKKILLFAVNLLLFSTISFAQLKLDYDNDSKWFWGFNYGATWNTSDVNYKLNHGWGLTLGKSFNYNYGKVFSFDIRARYLHGTWYGQNTDTSGFSSNYTGIYNQTNLNYKDSLGFAIHNFRADVNRLALELVLHANRIRENTGWDPYVFGGVGLTWYNSYTNIKNDKSFELNPIYQYDSTSHHTSTSLINLQDKTYETPLSSQRPSFMPSLGFGLGYQIGKRVSIGFEHKTTFTQTDNFDGVILASKYKQDLYHYTSAYIRFQLKSGSSRDNNTTQNSNPVNPTSNPQPPIVAFTNPNTTGTTVNTPNFSIKADVKYVDNRDHVIFKQENVINNNFTYDAVTDHFISNVVLQLGANTFEITGNNQYGTDVKTTIVIYKREDGTPPVVTITNPNLNPTTVNNPGYNFSATVLNLTQQAQISLTQNGQTQTSFTFNPTTHVVNAALVLQPGSNNIVITGTNAFGTDSKSTIINYERPQTELPPVVTITNPTINPYTVSEVSYNLAATVLNVSTKNQITVKVNGQNTTNFTYNPSNHSVAVPLNLIIGSNTIAITGTNTVGSDSKSTVIIYRKADVILPPVVTFITPNIDPYTSNTPIYLVSANVTNVNVAAGIQILFNGTTLSNFDFNPSTHLVSFNSNLIEGANTISIKGTNTAGSDVEDQTIIYVKPAVILPPVVTYIDPISTPTTVYNPIYNLQAKVLNVDGSSNIEVKINNIATTNFTYNNASKVVALQVNLALGANIIEIKGTNTVGHDLASTTIIYRKQDVAVPPVVTITNPSSNPHTSNIPSQSIIASVLNVETQQNIQVNVNGSILSNFSYNNVTKIVTFTMNLLEGNNNVTISGSNNAGQASDSRVIIYKKDVIAPPPFVTFVNPAAAGSTVNIPSFQMKATVSNVSTINQIELKKDGQIINQTLYSFNATTKEVVFNTNLNPGNNQFEVKGTNTVGTHNATSSINYVTVTPPCDKPNLTINNPNSSTIEVNQNTFTLNGTATHITQTNQIKIIVNGIEQASGIYNISTGIFTKEINLVQNLNTIEIKVTNTCGTVSQTRIIKYTPIVAPCNNPIIQPLSPNTMRYTTENSTLNISASVVNVINHDQIQVKVNGINVPFTFDASSLIISASVSFVNNSNTVEILVKNECGTANYKWNVNYIPCIEPILSINSSSIPNFSTTTNELVNFVIKVQNVNNQNQLGVYYNENSIPFTYNTVTKTISIQQNLVSGINDFVIKATTNCGRTSVQYQVTKEQPIPVKIPVITLLTPPNSPIKVNPGSYSVSGTISNITTLNQISITVNNQVITNVNVVFSTNGVQFDFPIQVDNTANEFNFNIQATNSAGSDTKSGTLLLSSNAPQNGNTPSPTNGPKTTIKPTGVIIKPTPATPTEGTKPVNTPTPTPTGRGGN
ncbi:MAG: hypothetical protein HYR91_11310 [Flavobacteriia bacterium]|nr:hypothetical protein [Flavobacteriia bacterium]